MALNYSSSAFDPSPGSTVNDSARAQLGFQKVPGYVNAYTHPVSPFILASCTSERNLLAYPMILVYQPIGRNVYVMSRDVFAELIRTRTLPIKFVPGIQDDQIAFAAPSRIARVCVNSMMGGGEEHWVSNPAPGYTVYDEAYLLHRFANIYATSVDSVTGNVRINIAGAELMAFGCLTQMDTGVVAYMAADTNGYRSYGLLSCKRFYSDVIAIFDDIAARFLAVHLDHPAIANVRGRVAALRASAVASWGTERTYQGPELSALETGAANPQWTFRLTVPKVKKLANPTMEGWQSAGVLSKAGTTRPTFTPAEDEARLRQAFSESGCVGFLLHERVQTAVSTVRASDGLKLAPFAVDFAADDAEKFEVLSVLGDVDPLLGTLAGGLEYTEKRYTTTTTGQGTMVGSYMTPSGSPEVSFLKTCSLRGNFEHAVIVKSFVNQLMWAVESTD